MSLQDDFANLFNGPPPDAFGSARVIQGQIVTFDKASGHNTVNVMGGVITDAQIAVNGADIGYVSGDPVMMLVIGNTYTILCKVTPAGGANYASAAQATIGYFASTPNQAYTAPSGIVLATANIVVPVWANRMTFFGMAEVYFKNAGSDSDCSVAHTMNGNGSGGPLQWASTGAHNQIFQKFQSGVQSVTPNTTIIATTSWSCTTSGTITGSQVSGTCIFSKA